MRSLSISYVDTCDACYLTDHHNRDGECLFGVISGSDFQELFAMRADTSERPSMPASSHQASDQVRDAQEVGPFPAPWVFDEKRGWVVSSPRYGKENVVAHVGPVLSRERANGMLISAVPDLLELVSDLYGEMMCRVNGQDAPQEACDCWVCEWASRAFDALRKAGVR